jgi:hypothetical protein
MEVPMKPWSLLLLLWLLSACHAAPAVGNGAIDREKNEATVVTIRGEVAFIDLEGGFFGIVDEEGHRYDPTNLPPEFAVAGLPVHIRGRTLPGTVGFHMWGTRIEIISIEKR